MSKKYPIGVETFSEIIEGGYEYVDKTEVVYKLTQAGKFFFLSRPRRFGKSLMLTTIEAYFEGRRELFDGLWLGQAEGVDWTPHAVLRLNFVNTHASVEGLKSSLDYQFGNWEAKYNVSGDNLDFGQRLSNIIQAAYTATGRQVVILIDEYDKVLVNTMRDAELQRQLKSILKPVFGVLKATERYLRFAILTGVSRFSKLSIFSDLNNIEDISLHPDYATICGITEAEARRYFASGIEEFAFAKHTDFEGMMQILKDNYDGYHFTRQSPDIYNPYSLILALKNRELAHRWFETGTPTFLLERIQDSDEDIRQLLSPMASGYSLATLSITDNDLTNMLYQTGYLTIKDYDEEDDIYMLGIPNREVATGLYRCLLPLYTGKDMTVNDGELFKLRQAVRAGNAEKFMTLLRSFLASIPQHLSEKKPEIYYENNLYLILKLIGFDVRTEEETADGRIDAVMKTPKYIYIIELKLNGTAQQAMEQIHAKQYALPYATDGRRLICIGISISKQTRTIDGWVVE